MTKNLLMSGIMLLALTGCASEAHNHLDVKKSSYYTHKTKILNVPYAKAVRNFKKGLHMCANNISTGNTRGIGGGIVMSGNKGYHHLVRKSNHRTEYDYRVIMGGVPIGDCPVCQPEGGRYYIYTVLERARGNKTKFSSHALWKDDEVKAQIKWIQGDLSSCHGYLGKK